MRSPDIIIAAPAVSAVTADGDAGPGTESGGRCLDRRCVLVAAAAGATAVLGGCGLMPTQQTSAGGAVTPYASGGGASAGTGAQQTAGAAAAGDAAAASDAGAPSAAGAAGDGMAAGGDMATPTKAAAKNKKAKAGKGLVALAAIPVGGGKVLTASKIVVTRPTATTVKAFSAVCTHQGCLVNEVADGTINCPCHGAKFDVADGTVAAGPAPAPLKAVKVAVKAGKVVKV